MSAASFISTGILIIRAIRMASKAKQSCSVDRRASAPSWVERA
jgi:hypothetical protein